MKKKDIIIAIPTHKAEPSYYEEISFRQCHKQLAEYSIRLLCPEGLSIQRYQEMMPAIQVEYFDSKWFSSLYSYNKFLLSPEIYNRFKKYEYLLIHELDAFVFRSNLLEWCNRRYDYIGAPWIKQDFITLFKEHANVHKYKILYRLKHRFNRNKRKEIFVGNGGLSLRRIRTFRLITRVLPYLFPTISRTHFQDDIVWSFYVSAFIPFFRIPSYQIAMKFSMETEPQTCLEQNNHHLPFGCHAWYKANYEFWKNYIVAYGYNI